MLLECFLKIQFAINMDPIYWLPLKSHEEMQDLKLNCIILQSAHGSKQVLFKALRWLLEVLPNSDTFEFQWFLIADPLYINFISQKLYITSHQTQIFYTLFLCVSLLYSVLHHIPFSPSQIRVNPYAPACPPSHLSILLSSTSQVPVQMNEVSTNFPTPHLL